MTSTQKVTSLGDLADALRGGGEVSVNVLDMAECDESRVCSELRDVCRQVV